MNLKTISINTKTNDQTAQKINLKKFWFMPNNACQRYCRDYQK